MASTSTSAPEAHLQWSSTADNDLTVENVRECLGSIHDDLWVAAACVDRLVDAVPVQRALLELGIERTANAVALSQNHLLNTQELKEIIVGAENARHNALIDYFRNVSTHAQLCHLRAVLLKRLDRLTTFVEMRRDTLQNEDEPTLDEWEDDPWTDGAAEPPSQATKSKPSVELPLSLSTFLTENLLRTSCLLATRQCFSALQVVCERHGRDIWPYRFTVLHSIPEHVPPQDYLDILPAFDVSSNLEQIWSTTHSRTELDWSETEEVQAALEASGIDLKISPASVPNDYCPKSKPLTASELSEWYTTRVDQIVSSTGMVDIALATIQHGASQGVPGLDELGEELSLLSRLVYDAPHSEDSDDGQDWTLAHWKSMDPASIVRAYLAHSKSDTVANDILRLVLPYLYVLESRAERAGNPDPSLHTRLLYDYILTAPLDLAASIFEASKPTLPAGQRLVKNEEDTVRLALACLYGSDSINQWSTMSSIFECMPAWDMADDDIDGDVADTTVASLGKYVTPTTARPRCTASDLLIFFTPLPKSSLSRALDILDVHLMSGETLARWGVPAPLRWFLRSSDDVVEQRAWANRMARRTGRPSDKLDTHEDWEWLLEDMLKLLDPGAGESGVKGAFGLLTRQEVINIFFSGLLSTGKLDIAKKLLYSSKQGLSLDQETIENICLNCSREFYDNASSANYKFGEMKLAYDCLDVPRPSVRLVREKEFIEATSRLSSFNIMSKPGIPISPIEIRLTKDRLSLVSRVLSSNADAYKHTEVILDLVYKLGFRDDAVAEIKVFAMLADTALQAEDFTRAYETSQRMIDAVLALRSTSSLGDPRVQEASDVCWVACFQLGRQPEFDDIEKRLSLLGRALEFCPPEKLHDVVLAWRRLDKEDIENRRERLSSRQRSGAPTTPKKRPANSSSIDSLTSRLQDFRMSTGPLLKTPDPATLAGRTLRSVAANFPFSLNNTHEPDASDRISEKQHRPHSGDVSAQASRVLSKGLGWLMGEDL